MRRSGVGLNLLHTLPVLPVPFVKCLQWRAGLRQLLGQPCHGPEYGLLPYGHCLRLIGQRRQRAVLPGNGLVARHQEALADAGLPVNGEDQVLRHLDGEVAPEHFALFIAPHKQLLASPLQ